MNFLGELYRKRNSSNEFRTEDDTNGNNKLGVNNKKTIVISDHESLSFNAIRNLSKEQLETFEHWSRRIIDDFFSEDYGRDYLDAMVKTIPDQPLIKKVIRNRIRGRMKANPGRFSRDIDAILIEDLAYFFTRKDLYDKYFKTVFFPFYSGPEEVRLHIERLVDIRNKLYHDNPISLREAEQVLCYTNDFIDTFKNYYQIQGRGKDFNVPVILSFSDSQGNRSFRIYPDVIWEVKNINAEDKKKYSMLYPDAIVTNHRSGEEYIIELEVDSSFSRDSYDIRWDLKINYEHVLTGEGEKIRILFTDEMVSFSPDLEIKLITHKNWRRFGHYDCDDFVKIHLNRVLPPIGSGY